MNPLTQEIDYPNATQDPHEIAYREYEHQRWIDNPESWSPLINLEQLEKRPDLEIEWYSRPWIPVGAKTILSAEPKTGKALAANTLIPLPTGELRAIKDLKEGDFVFGSEGKSVKVIGVFPQGKQKAFKVGISDGTSIICDERHLWSVQNWNGIQRNCPLTTKSLADIRKTKLRATDKHWVNYIPTCSPVEFERKELPIHPYLLGVLLGDGGLTQSTPILTSYDIEIVNRVSTLLPLGVTIKEIPQTPKNYRLTGRGQGSLNPLTKILRVLGLMGHSSLTKFIPLLYKTSSIEDRLELLRGLCDTDGTIGLHNGTEYSSSSLRLIQDVQFLIESLGGRGRITSRKTKVNISYRMVIGLPPGMNPFWLQRKAEKYTKIKTPRRAIASIEELTEPQEMVCIAVDAKDSLFVAEHFIVTHNTIFLFHVLKAITNGEEFLGEPCPPTRVLYLTEQTEQEFKRQICEIPGLIGNPNFFVLLAEETPDNMKTWEDMIEFAEEYLEKIKAKILVIDTFGSLAKLPPGGENDSATIQVHINKLNKLFRNRYLSVVLTHHNRKKNEDLRASNNPINMSAARGSSAFVGGAGHLIYMNAPDNSSRRDFTFFGRYKHNETKSLYLINNIYQDTQYNLAARRK